MPSSRASTRTSSATPSPSWRSPALAPRIRVNAIAPAVTLVSGPQSRENFAAAHRLNPLGTGVEVGHLAGALRYLLHTPSVTGETLTLDSGQRFLGLPRDVAYMVCAD
jgi:NAD(P)-dependent dehydrogenase (short-subunit alcohol dehydrogenase family)